MFEQTKLKLGRWPVIISLLLVIPFVGCGDDEPADTFMPDFSYSFMDDNNVRFSNESTGEYQRLNWDFGNGRTESTTSKSKQFEVYYPQAGQYDVELVLIGLQGNRESIQKTVNITNTDFAMNFTATVDVADPNIVNLENTTEGTYDSFTWFYRHKEIEDEASTTAYFPYAGTYDIELQVMKDGETYSLVQTVIISEDDPDYSSRLQLVWSDEFDGDTVNEENWTFETGASGWGNNELQNYTSGQNSKVENGRLTITARKIDENKQPGSYTSSRMISRDKYEFTYGKMEIRAKLPSGTGIWPAIWMLGTNIGEVGWPTCGEIDIMEYVGYQPNTIHATVHTSAGYGSNGKGSSKTLESAEEDFHVYGLIWTEKEMIFYTDSLDNVTFRYAPANKTADNWPFDKPQFFILNVAVGGNWGGAQGIDNSIFPQTMEVDYVRVYQEE